MNASYNRLVYNIYKGLCVKTINTRPVVHNVLKKIWRSKSSEAQNHVVAMIITMFKNLLKSKVMTYGKRLSRTLIFVSMET